MTAEAIIALILQLMSLFPTVAPALVQAVKDVEMLFANGAQPTQEQIDELLSRVKAQSVTIQNQPD